MQKLHLWYRAVLSLWGSIVLLLFLYAVYNLIFNQGSDNGPYGLLYAMIWGISLIAFHFIIYNGIYKKYRENQNLKQIEDATRLYQQNVISEQEYQTKIAKLKEEYLSSN